MDVVDIFSSSNGCVSPKGEKSRGKHHEVDTINSIAERSNLSLDSGLTAMLD